MTIFTYYIFCVIRKDVSIFSSSIIELSQDVNRKSGNYIFNKMNMYSLGWEACKHTIISTPYWE